MRRALIAAACLALCAPALLRAEPYRLHPQDRLLIRVLTWDFRQNSLVGWQDLSGEYSLSPEGDLQLPLAGTVAAAGLTQAELADAVSVLLRRRAGLTEPPLLSIELVSSVPVYVLGAVETRGAVPFRPGLSARQALALAGGVYRPAGGADPLRAAAVAADLRLAGDRLARLRAERAALDAELTRLRAETTGAAPPTAVPPAGPPGDPDAATGAEQAERTARRVRLESYAELGAMLGEKATRLTEQVRLRDRQIAETRKELDAIESLNERGLAVNARVTSLSTALSELEAKRLELETAMLLLEEQRNQAERDSGTLVADAIADRMRRLAELDGLIADAATALEAARLQSAMLGRGDGGGEAEPVFTLVRDGVTLAVPASHPLQPGDTLEIALRPAATPAAEPVAAPGATVGLPGAGAAPAAMPAPHAVPGPQPETPEKTP